MLKERINILQQANVISDIVATYVKRVIDELEPTFAKNQSGMEMFTTHLAMATQRITQQENGEELDDVIWNDVMLSPYFEQANVVYESITKYAPCTFPQGEKKFLIMHLCNLHQ